MSAWPQTKRKKTLAEFKSGGGTSQHIMSSQTLRACLSESVAALSLEQGHEFANLHNKYNWEHASAKLAICTARVGGAPGRAKSATACIVSSHIMGKNNILIWQFQLRLPNCQI